MSHREVNLTDRSRVQHLYSNPRNANLNHMEASCLKKKAPTAETYRYQSRDQLDKDVASDVLFVDYLYMNMSTWRNGPKYNDM